MAQQRARKPFKYKLVPPPEQEPALATVLWRCRERYNAGLEERKAAWEQRRVWVTCAMQSAPLPASTEVRPEERALNAPVVQDGLHRLEKALAAFFRRVTTGAHPGSPRCQGKDRYTSCTDPQVGEHGGAALDGGML